MQTIMEIQIELSLVWNLDKVIEMRWDDFQSVRVAGFVKRFNGQTQFQRRQKYDIYLMMGNVTKVHVNQPTQPRYLSCVQWWCCQAYWKRVLCMQMTTEAETIIILSIFAILD